MKQDEEIKIREATKGDMGQLCKVRNNEKLYEEYLEECDRGTIKRCVKREDGVILKYKKKT